MTLRHKHVIAPVLLAIGTAILSFALFPAFAQGQGFVSEVIESVNASQNSIEARLNQIATVSEDGRLMIRSTSAGEIASLRSLMDTNEIKLKLQTQTGHAYPSEVAAAEAELARIRAARPQVNEMQAKYNMWAGTMGDIAGILAGGTIVTEEYNNYLDTLRSEVRRAQSWYDYAISLFDELSAYGGVESPYALYLWFNVPDSNGRTGWDKLEDINESSAQVGEIAWEQGALDYNAGNSIQDFLVPGDDPYNALNFMANDLNNARIDLLTAYGESAAYINGYYDIPGYTYDVTWYYDPWGDWFQEPQQYWDGDWFWDGSAWYYYGDNFYVLYCLEYYGFADCVG